MKGEEGLGFVGLGFMGRGEKAGNGGGRRRLEFLRVETSRRGKGVGMIQ